MKHLSILCILVGAVLVVGPCHHGPQHSPTATTGFEVDGVATDGADPAPPEQPAPSPAAVVVTQPTTTIPPSAQPDRLQRAAPVTTWLPYDTSHWSIDYRSSGATLNLVITLKVIVNRADQLPQVQVELRQYKGEALEWLLEHGVQQATYPIEWRPTAAAAL